VQRVSCLVSTPSELERRYQQVSKQEQSFLISHQT